MTTEKKPFIKSEGNSRYKKPQKKQATRSAPAKSFQGETPTLEGHTYDIGIPNQSEVFTQTTKKIASYAGRNCREAHSMRTAIENLKTPTFAKPTMDTDGDQDVNKMLLIEATNAYVKRTEHYRIDSENMFSVILGQCTDAIKAELEAIDE